MGRVAFLTGAASGIGQALAQALSSFCDKIILTEHKTSIEETREKISRNCEVEVLPCDLADFASVERAGNRVQEEKELSFFVHAAGIARDTLVLRLKREEVEEVMATNFLSAVLLTQRALKPMLKKRFGRILFISSVVAHRSNPGQSVYAASKAALEAFAKTTAREMAARNITINCIAPGFIQTRMTEALSPLQKEKILQNIPMGKFGQVSDITGLAKFLFSEEAAYITGQTFLVDGGLNL